MEITCWNCKKVTTFNKAAVEAAIAQMDTSKLGFHDVACASCGKSNRTARDLFTAGLEAFVKAAAQPVLNKREATKKNKEANKAKRAEKGH
jgi:hypothetical protein